jgi:osmotically-inducible protein OsmY
VQAASFNPKWSVVMGDLALRQDVLDELEFQPNLKATHVGVAVENGVVTLSGHVGSYAEKATAVTATKRIKGVRAIADELEVRYPDDRKSADDQIAKRIVDILSWNVELNTTTIQAVVRDGCVILTGDVEWQFQKKAAEADVRKLSGVREILNRIEIRPRVRPADVVRQIDNALKRHGKLHSRGIQVLVDGQGRVVLEGKVDTWGERTAVENAAWSIPGVRSVMDHLSLR